MTHDELDHLDALAAAATEGQWTTGDHPADDCSVFLPNGRVLIHDEGTHTAADAAFIAAARDAVPALVAAVRERDTEIERLRAALHQIARRDDDEMAAAKTLHYDMRGWAQRALDGGA